MINIVSRLKFILNQNLNLNRNIKKNASGKKLNE